MSKYVKTEEGREEEETKKRERGQQKLKFVLSSNCSTLSCFNTDYFSLLFALLRWNQKYCHLPYQYHLHPLQEVLFYPSWGKQFNWQLRRKKRWVVAFSCAILSKIDCHSNLHIWHLWEKTLDMILIHLQKLWNFTGWTLTNIFSSPCV